MKIGFIGCGNMARAIISGLIASKTFAPEEIIASDKSEAALNEAAEKFGINTTTNNCALVLESEMLLLAVKPQILPAVAEEIADVVDESKLIISIVAGQDIKKITELFGKKLSL